MWTQLAQAACLMLVLEGIVPFLYPNRWRQLAAKLAIINDRQLRMIGLGSMVVGAILLFVIRS